MLKFLQQNAEWMCAIAIMIFSAVQCWLVHQQNMQNIRMKRLELAHKLDEFARAYFHATSLEKKAVIGEISTWLVSNASNFAFLLNSRDSLKWRNFCQFIIKYVQPISIEDQEETVRQFSILVCELNHALGNANYGFVKANDKILKQVKKYGGRIREKTRL